jgi:hypothetical protein
MKKILLITPLCLVVTVSYAYGRGGGHGGGGGRGGGGHGGGFSGHGFSGGSRGFSGGGFSQHSSSSGVRSYSGGGYRGSYGGGYSHLSSAGSVRSYSGGGYRGGYTGGYHGGYVAGHSYSGHYYSGGYYGGYNRYYYRGYAPYGAAFGFFLGGVVVGGIYNPFWWPYYSVPVPPAYYDPYYQFPHGAPPYVMEVPPTEATTAYSQQPPPATMPPNQCYAPKTDQNGNVIKENDNPIPDFSKPLPCPPQQ